jgi:hypothetical protein
VNVGAESRARLLSELEAVSLVELLRQGVEIVNAAIENGDWRVDGRCDPDQWLHHATVASGAAPAGQPAAVQKPEAHLYVLCARYPDNSGFKLLGVFDSQKTADDRKRLLEDIGCGMDVTYVRVPLNKSHVTTSIWIW